MFEYSKTDGAKLNIPKDIFKQSFPKYIDYLQKHKGEWDIFIAGGIYPEPRRIVSKDPFIIECNWIACSHFNIYSEKSANTVISYEQKGKYDTSIDNHIARSHTNKIWVPYPMFASQYCDDTYIGNYDSYLPTIAKAFNDSFRIFDEFVFKYSK